MPFLWKFSSIFKPSSPLEDPFRQGHLVELKRDFLCLYVTPRKDDLGRHKELIDSQGQVNLMDFMFQ